MIQPNPRACENWSVYGNLRDYNQWNVHKDHVVEGKHLTPTPGILAYFTK